MVARFATKALVIGVLMSAAFTSSPLGSGQQPEQSGCEGYANFPQSCERYVFDLGTDNR